MKKKTDRKKLEDKLDQIVRDIVRLRDNGVCYTCGTQCKSQVGHYVPRARRLERWDLKNCHCQCTYCNCNMEGSKPKYRENLIRDYGIDVVEDMEARMYMQAHFTISDLEEIYADLQKELDKLV